MQAFAVIIVIRGTRIMANFAGVQLHGTMRRMACMTMMMAAIVTGLCACTEKTEITTDMNGNGATDNDNFQIRMTKSVPSPIFFGSNRLCVLTEHPRIGISRRRM